MRTFDLEPVRSGVCVCMLCWGEWDLRVMGLNPKLMESNGISE